jgi:uncharacterized membrane protein YdbT with pleckstrin-like domain
MENYVEANLAPGERILYKSQVHWVVYLAPVLLLSFGLPWLSIGGKSGLAIVAVGLIAGAAAYVRQATSEFAITDKRVIFKTGLFSRKTIEINRARVESVEVDQDIIGRLLNYGTVTVAGTGGTREPFTLIDNPLEFRRMVQTAQA